MCFTKPEKTCYENHNYKNHKKEKERCFPKNHHDRVCVLTVKIRQPSHEFTFGVGISFIPYPLVLTLLV
jgi:hypothetical protein